MKNVTIKSHLTVPEWKMSFEDKVVEDTRENMRAYQQSNCFWGHFMDDDNFIICHHKDGEIKGMSLGLYFTGRVQKDEHGCTVTGSFGRKLTANIFLGFGAILCILAMIGSLSREDTEVLVVSSILLILLFMIYFYKPKSGQKIILDELEKISFDDKFHNKRIKSKKKKKRTLKEKASVEVRHEKKEGKAGETDLTEASDGAGNEKTERSADSGSEKAEKRRDAGADQAEKPASDNTESAEKKTSDTEGTEPGAESADDTSVKS